MTWPCGRTPQTSDPESMMRWYGLGRTGNLGSLSCKGGHRSKRCRRLWSRRGKPCLLAFFRQSFWLFFRRGGPTARTCCAWVETQTSRLASVLARSLRIRSWLMGSFQRIYHSCPDKWPDRMREVPDPFPVSGIEAKPIQAKVLTEGGDLSASRRPPVC